MGYASAVWIINLPGESIKLSVSSPLQTVVKLHYIFELKYGDKLQCQISLIKRWPCIRIPAILILLSPHHFSHQHPPPAEHLSSP